MPKAIKDVKALSSEAKSNQNSKTSGESQQDLFAEANKPNRNLVEFPQGRQESSIASASIDKIKQPEFYRIERRKREPGMPPKPANWNITDGDYISGLVTNEENQLHFFEERRKAEKIYLAAALILVALTALLFSVLTSSIKSF